MAYLDCLNILVALSNRDFECFTDEAPEGYNVSTSGYSLTDPDFGAGFLEACEVNGWTILQSSLTMAVRDFKTDLATALRNYFDSSVVPFRGFVGQMKSSGISQPVYDFVGHRFQPMYRKGMKLVIKAFYLGFNVGGTYTIQVRSNDPTFTNPADVSGSVTANVFTKVSIPDNGVIELPFYSDAIEDLEYYVSIDRQGANPLYNTFSCCGNKPGYKDHFVVDGFQATSETGTNLDATSAAQGLVIDGYVTCEELGWLCNLSELNGLSVSDLAARTIQARGSAIAIAQMVDSPIINLCGLYNLESLQTKRNFLNGQYQNNIQWIAQNLPKGATDCFTCKAEETFFKTNLIV